MNANYVRRILAGLFMSSLGSLVACIGAEEPLGTIDERERVGSASQAISLGSSLGMPIYSGSTCGLNNGVTPTCAVSSASDMSFQWTAPSSGTFTFTTAGSNFDTVLVFEPYSTPTVPLACTNAVSGTGGESVSLTLSGGQQIIITIDGYASLCGNYKLNVSKNCASPCTSPSNCQTGGTCSIAGTCVYTLKPAGTACDDGNACTTTDVCNAAGTCSGTSSVTTFYRDADGDGYGNPAVSVQGCSKPLGYVTNMTDCNDSNSAVHPGATETCNGADDNCDGAVDENACNFCPTGYELCPGDCCGRVGKLCTGPCLNVQ